MVRIALAILWTLIGLCIIVGTAYVVVFVCASLGIPLPAMAVKIAELVLGLLLLIHIIRIVAQGGDGNPFKW